MAEIAGVMLRRKPKQMFTVFVSWNLSAIWRRIKKFQWPWAPFTPPQNRVLPRDTTTEVLKSNEEYLRPTPGINPYEPELVALAVQLGLNEKNKREFVEAAYHWVKNHLRFYLETPPDGVINTLKKGYGICMNKMSVFVALSRLAGIPARFVSYKQEMGGGFMEMMIDEMIGETGEEIVRELKESRATFTHGCVELFLDDEWVPADLTWTEEEEVGLGLPISQFGESPFGKWYNIVPDSVNKSESLPWGKIRSVMRRTVFFLRGVADRVNERFDRIREFGRKKLEEMGRDAYIESKKKFYVPMPKI